MSKNSAILPKLVSSRPSWETPQAGDREENGTSWDGVPSETFAGVSRKLVSSKIYWKGQRLRSWQYTHPKLPPSPGPTYTHAGTHAHAHTGARVRALTGDNFGDPPPFPLLRAKKTKLLGDQASWTLQELFSTAFNTKLKQLLHAVQLHSFILKLNVIVVFLILKFQ